MPTGLNRKPIHIYHENIPSSLSTLGQFHPFDDSTTGYDDRKLGLCKSPGGRTAVASQMPNMRNCKPSFKEP